MLGNKFQTSKLILCIRIPGESALVSLDYRDTRTRILFFSDSDPTVLEDKIIEIFESQQIELLSL